MDGTKLKCYIKKGMFWTDMGSRAAPSVTVSTHSSLCSHPDHYLREVSCISARQWNYMLHLWQQLKFIHEDCRCWTHWPVPPPFINRKHLLHAEMKHVTKKTQDCWEVWIHQPRKRQKSSLNLVSSVPRHLKTVGWKEVMLQLFETCCYHHFTISCFIFNV